jgi:predicted DNA-binding transcriptional regulator YafY
MSTGDYSESVQVNTQPLELEASTTEAPRPPEPVQSVEGLTIAEAATAYGLSVSSIRRLISKGKLIGAVKVPGSKGAEYRIPGKSLEALGYKPKETQGGALLSAARANLEAEELTRKVRELEATLALEVVRRESAETELVAVRENLNDLREVLAKLPAQLEAPKKKRLFRRSS